MMKSLLRSIPYLCASLVGVLIFFLAGSLSGLLQDLLINVAASFLSIPLLLLFYELVKDSVDRNLNMEISEYAKVLIDKEMLSTLNQLSKVLYPLDRHDFSLQGIENFLNLKKENVESEIRKNTYLGFQVFKHWEIADQAIEDLLSNSYICQKMENKQLIALINIMKNLKNLEQIQKSDGLYVESNEKVEGFKIQKGKDLNPSNSNLPERYILLKHLEEDKYQVFDFGDFRKYNDGKLLKTFKVNENATGLLSDIVFNLISSIKRWVNVSGNDIIIDQEMFRVRPGTKIK